MLKTLRIQIECGETTCASEPGRFCRFLGSRRMGTVPVCMLFPEKNPGRKHPGGITELEQTTGWLQRCPACLAAQETGRSKI